jgi:hypothetical protein
MPAREILGGMMQDVEAMIAEINQQASRDDAAQPSAPTPLLTRNRSVTSISPLEVARVPRAIRARHHRLGALPVGTSID